MKIISIKVEASHIDSSIATMLEFIAVAFDISTDFKPIVYHKRFDPGKTFKCSLSAVIHNAELLDNIHKYANNLLLEKDSTRELYGVVKEHLYNDFSNWISYNDLMYVNHEMDFPYNINVVGKNFQRYDLTILQRIDPMFCSLISRRILDVSNLFIEPTDIHLPDMAICKKRSGLYEDKDILNSTKGLEVAMDMAKLTHHKLSKTL